MNSYHTIPVRLGAAAPEIVSTDYHELYRRVAGNLLHGVCNAVPSSRPATIPIDNNAIQNAPTSIFTHIMQRVQQLDRPVDLVIIEVDDLHARILLYLVLAIQGLLLDKNINIFNQKPLFCILLPILPCEGESVLDILQPYISANHVILIDAEGKSFPANAFRTKESVISYERYLTKARALPEKLLQVKMIRRLGHYKRIRKTKRREQHYACVHHYYDGTLCDSEIEQLITRYLQKHYTQGMTPLILHEDDASEWLRKPLYAVALRHDIPCESIKNALRSNPLQALTPTMPQPLYITSFVDTGDTLRTNMKKILAVNPRLKPRFLSVLTTHPTDLRASTRTIPIDESISVDVTYFMHVQRETSLPQDCEMCRLGIVESPKNGHRDPVMLTSYEMWHMVREAGLLEEQSLTYRTELGKIPDYARIMELNGPWLASKVRRYFIDVLGGMPLDPTVICPQEKGAEMFSDYLHYMLDFTVILVPRSVIDIFSSGGAIGQYEAEWMSQPWYIRLTQATQSNIIVLDEYISSGKTSEGLTRLLLNFGKTVSYYFFLNDLRPSEVSSAAPKYTLYSWQR